MRDLSEFEKKPSTDEKIRGIESIMESLLYRDSFATRTGIQHPRAGGAGTSQACYKKGKRDLFGDHRVRHEKRRLDGERQLDFFFQRKEGSHTKDGQMSTGVRIIANKFVHCLNGVTLTNASKSQIVRRKWSIWLRRCTEEK